MAMLDRQFFPVAGSLDGAGSAQLLSVTLHHGPVVWSSEVPLCSLRHSGIVVGRGELGRGADLGYPALPPVSPRGSVRVTVCACFLCLFLVCA